MLTNVPFKALSCHAQLICSIISVVRHFHIAGQGPHAGMNALVQAFVYTCVFVSLNVL